MTRPRGIAVAVSDLLADDDVRRRVEPFADAFELRDRHGPMAFETPAEVLFHSDQNLLAPLDVAAIERRVGRWMAGGQLALVSLHALSCYTAPVLEGRMFQPGGRRMDAAEMLEHACRNADALARTLGGVSIAVENNNYLPSPAYDVIAEPAFIARVVHASGASFLLDLAHAAISARHLAVAFDRYLAELPLDRVAQVHLAGCGRHGEVWTDDHSEPGDAEWATLAALLPDLPALRFVTLEYYTEADRLVRLHEQLAALLERGAVPVGKTHGRGVTQ